MILFRNLLATVSLILLPVLYSGAQQQLQEGQVPAGVRFNFETMNPPDANGKTPAHTWYKFREYYQVVFGSQKNKEYSFRTYYIYSPEGYWFLTGTEYTGKVQDSSSPLLPSELKISLEEMFPGKKYKLLASCRTPLYKELYIIEWPGGESKYYTKEGLTVNPW